MISETEFLKLLYMFTISADNITTKQQNIKIK